MYKYIVSLLVMVLILSSCGTGTHGVKFIPTPGVCADGKLNAPYCMSISVSNNESAQNFITNASPINNLTMTIHGADNILNPFTNSTKLDPHGCFESTIVPGESCIFFLQLSKESSSAGSIKDVDLEFKYNTLKNLFNNDDNESSISNTPIKIINNIYVILADPYRSVWRTNDLLNNRFELKQAESLATGAIISSYLDNNNYGYLDLSTNNSMFAFSMLFDNLGGSLLNFAAGGANNLIANGHYLYASGINKTGIWRIDTLNPAWDAQSPTYNAGSLNFAPNIATISPINSDLYLVANNQLYRCVTNDNNNPNCSLANVNIPGTPSNKITTLGFATIQNTVIAGTNEGIFFLESNLNINSSWQPTTITQAISSRINDTTTGQNFFGSNDGNIYLIDENNLDTPILFFNDPQARAIAAMAMDTIDHRMLFAATNSQGISIYSCMIDPHCGDLKHIGDIPSTAKIVGLHIGSELNSN